MNERAVYYARVSTEEERQLNALEKQCSDLFDCISNNGWIKVDEYIDEGKSGTSIKRRDEYNRLFEDISKDKWDILVIKSQDRLMRNVKDWYNFISELITNNKRLFIYMENTFYKSNDSFLTGIKAMLAEEYSRDLSKKLNNAHKRRSAEGSSVMSNNKIWGYTKLKGELVIDENEAKIVRRIFEMYVDEKRGIREIINELEKEGVFTNEGKKFAPTTVNRILKNEKYMGTMICNKQHKDFDTKKVIKNPKSEWIIHENRIPVIISKEVFDKAQSLRKSRSKIFCPDGTKKGKRETKHPLGGKVYCGYCEKVMWYNAVKKTFKDNNRIEYRYPWMCSTYSRLGRKGLGKYPDEGCNKKNINDQFLKDELMIMADNLNKLETKNSIMVNYLKNIEDSLNIKNEKIDIEAIKKLITEIEKKQSLLVDKFLDEIIPDEVYKRKNKELEDEIIKKKNELELAINQKENEDTIENELKTLKKMFETQLHGNLSYIELCQLISKIIAYDDHVEIYLYFMEDMCFTIDKSLEFITNSFKSTKYTDARVKR